MKMHLMLYTLPFALSASLYSRSPFRTADPKAPSITARWKGSAKGVTVYDNHFRQSPLFTYETKDLQDNLVPDIIPYADGSGQLSKKQLDTLIENAIQEIFKKKRKIKKARQLNDFTILQYKNFSFKRGCGLIVLKFKDHPFVLKLFMENPKTFANPYIKGMEPIFFHYMAGGVSRHISGLTRIKNLELLTNIIKKDPLWGPHIFFPRKWYWLAQNNKNLEIIGKNIAANEIRMDIPGTYAIIADYIETENQIELPIRLRKQMVMQFSNDISTYLDPHFNNYVFHPAVIDGENTFKITVIDTEHFPTIVGLEKTKHFKNHFSWYMHLAHKCIYDMYFKTKQELRTDRTKKSLLCLDEPIFYSKTL